MENLKITNEDFFNYIQGLTTSELKGLNYRLSEVEPMKVTTGVGGDKYGRLLVGVERKGKTLLIKGVGEFAEVEKYTYKLRKKRARRWGDEDKIVGVYRLKGENFGHVNFNEFTNYRVREI
tara:strand:- start:2102 stop:2464 length:363 start_codon:yes stop_codon:yes gene_type:complete